MKDNGFKFGRRSKAKLYGDNEHPGVAVEVAQLCELALTYTKCDFGIIDGVRLRHEQRGMYDAKHSALDGTNKISDHQIGLAIDFLPTNTSGMGEGLDMYDTKDPRVLAVWLECYRAFTRAGRKLNLALEFGLGYLIHGGPDMPHISIVGKIDKTVREMAIPMPD